jgi:hypothetical protein
MQPQIALAGFSPSWSEARMCCNPVLCKILEPDAPRGVVDPLPASLIGFNRRQPSIGVRLGSESARGSSPGSVGSGERCLPPARRKLANTAKASTATRYLLPVFGSGGTGSRHSGIGIRALSQRRRRPRLPFGAGPNSSSPTREVPRLVGGSGAPISGVER